MLSFRGVCFLILIIELYLWLFETRQPESHLHDEKGQNSHLQATLKHWSWKDSYNKLLTQPTFQNRFNECKVISSRNFPAFPTLQFDTIWLLQISHSLILFNWIESKPLWGSALQTFGVCLWSQQLDPNHPVQGAFSAVAFFTKLSNMYFYLATKWSSGIAVYMPWIIWFDLMYGIYHFNFILHVRLFSTFRHGFKSLICFRIKGWKLWSGHWANSL